MAAVTAILAAVIGTFVTGTGSDVQPSAQAGVTFDYDGATDELTVRVIDAGNVDALYIENRDDPVQNGDISSPNGWDTNVDGDRRVVNEDPDGGDSVVIDGTANDDDVVITGEVDGEETLLDGWELE
ncbi:type IV pilin N-terminal domain-containing protein [Halorutilus salinus]